jgi:mannose-6-phosphate isomerase-like protein (cupin superfamily)
MSKKRQLSERQADNFGDVIEVRSFAVRHLRSYLIPTHTHDWHQLIYAGEGVMWVQTSQGEWVVPPNRAVWVPAGVEHSIDMSRFPCRHASSISSWIN